MKLILLLVMAMLAIATTGCLAYVINKRAKEYRKIRKVTKTIKGNEGSLEIRDGLVLSMEESTRRGFSRLILSLDGMELEVIEDVQGEGFYWDYFTMCGPWKEEVYKKLKQINEESCDKEAKL